jgi:hypothetical protein
MASHAASPPPPPPPKGKKKGAATPLLLHTSIYSPKALLVQGDTYPHREALKEMGGVWNKGLRGWLFSRRTRSEQVGVCAVLCANIEYWGVLLVLRRRTVRVVACMCTDRGMGCGLSPPSAEYDPPTQNH